MSRFQPVNLIAHYRQLGTEDVPLEDYAAQLERCQSCKERIRGQCRKANQPVQLIARKRMFPCPLDLPKPKPRSRASAIIKRQSESPENKSWLEGNF